MVTDAQRSKLNDLVRSIDDGRLTPAPRLPGDVGAFLRERVAWVRDRTDWLTKQGVAVYGGGPEISGAEELCGPVRLRPLRPPTVHTDGNEHHQRAVASAVSEELGGVVHVVMWLSGTSGMAAFNMLRDSPAVAVRLSGDYRWTVPARITVGESDRAACADAVDWERAPCLKAVADDLCRPPHAAQYVWDESVAPAGPKYFRCICAQRVGSSWNVLPAFQTALPLPCLEEREASDVGDGELWALLVYSEPWSLGSWRIVSKKSITVEAAYQHAVAWSDAQAELDDTASSRQERRTGITDAFDQAGLGRVMGGVPRTESLLLPLARRLRRYLEHRA